jgi:type 1 glutamine amidotransferase
VTIPIPRRSLLLGFLATLAVGLPSLGAEKLRVLIIDGQNNHNWVSLTPILRDALEKTGRFSVEVATTPPKGAKAAEWDQFSPVFSKYDAVVSNYNGERWPSRVEKALETYVADGGGLVNVHAANNAFEGWPEFNKMIGLGWRNNKFGDRVTIDDSGKVVRTPKGEGLGAGHGPQHAYKVAIRESSHPVTQGMPAEWLHAKDELYQGQRGPAENMEILATAYASKDQKGSGTNEPMLWVIPYGKGRVFTTVMGHTMGNETIAARCVGFQTVLARGTEWAATGKVTIPIPENFPTATKESAVAESSNRR